MAAGTKVQLRLGERVVAEVAFDGAALRIGRMKENDLVINNLAVSRFHAVLRRMGDAFEIEDLGSENGSLVEGVAVRGTAPVSPGEAITIGKHTLVIRSGEAGAPKREPAGKSDAWDAAQTYFVPGAAPRAGAAEQEPEEEAVAVAVEVDRDEDGVAELIEAVEEVAPSREPVPLGLPDEDGALAFGEDELVGQAAPDPRAAATPSASVEPAELLMEDEPALAAPEPPRASAPAESGGQTALFDFGLTDDLGLSDRSLARQSQARGAGPVATPAPAAPPPLHAGLIVERAGRVERVVPWGEAELVAGRSPECALVLGGSGVSRRHVRFVREGTAFRVSDLGSANGIRVNGKRVESAALAVGDVVAIDDYAVTFVLDREPVEGVLRAAQPPAQPRAVPEARHAIPERDLVLEGEDDGVLADGEKELELAAGAPQVGRATAGAAGLRWEIAIATERLPAALRRALEELGEDELRLPAELRLVRKG